jgi:hypothetical protein
MSNTSSDKTLLEEVQDAFDIHGLYDPHYQQQFFEFDLADFDLPTADELLNATFAIEKDLGRLQGWRSNNKISDTYKGFSLTYNPANGDDAYQTWGDPRLTQNFSRAEGTGNIDTLKNSYHDTYRFSVIHPAVAKHYAPLLDRLNCQLTRSRVAYIDPVDDTIYNYNYHRDEFPFQNLRVNIPLQTSPEYVLEITGSDEFGNALELEKHLEVGKFYVWNTRIPHRVYAKGPPQSLLPRIHIVLGVMPWINVDGDAFTKNQFFGTHPFDLLRKGLLFK